MAKILLSDRVIFAIGLILILAAITNTSMVESFMLGVGCAFVANGAIRRD